MTHEAFVYLWYDALNKMYYLGSHKGEPTDDYAHSSSMMESFTMNTKPAYMYRKILAFGTHKEMLALESELQANRKERCWDRYYNVVVCEPFYGGFSSGENHPQWKGGISLDKTSYMKVYQQTPAQVEYQAKYMKTYWQSRENKDKANKRRRELYANSSEFRKKDLERGRKRRARLSNDPVWVENRRKKDRERYARKKAEKQGTGTLKEFMS